MQTKKLPPEGGSFFSNICLKSASKHSVLGCHVRGQGEYRRYRSLDISYARERCEYVAYTKITARSEHGEGRQQPATAISDAHAATIAG